MPRGPRTHHCSVCREIGHNSSVHKKSLTERKCCYCAETKPIEQFYLRRNITQAGESKSRLTWCIQCQADKHRERVQERPRQRIVHTVCSIRSRCKKRGYDFNLTTDYMEKLWYKQKGMCAYTGKPMNLRAYNDEVMTIDRINPNLGYVKGNVCFATRQFNFMKTNFTPAEFVEACKLVIKTLGDPGHRFHVPIDD